MRPLSLWLRVAIYGGCAALWLTGGVIFALKHYFQAATEFGPVPHPWQPKLLALHGLIAVPVLYVFGWISARHVGEAWRRGGNRTSGLSLLALITVLAFTGFAGYYLIEDTTRAANGWIHSLVGLALIAPGLSHWFAGARLRRQRVQ